MNNCNWQDTWTNTVRTEEDLVRFVNTVGCCTINMLGRFPIFPSQEVAMGLRDVLGHTWFWKDDLHTRRHIYYSRLFAGKPGFIALDMLPAFIATNGEVADELLLTGALPAAHGEIYRIIEERGPIPIKQLKALLSDDVRRASAAILIDLECRFIIAKTGITGREMGTYGNVWDLAERWMPDAFTEADRLGRTTAREMIEERLRGVGVTVDNDFRKRVLRWKE